MTEGADLPRKVDPALLKAVARSKAWFEELASGRVRSLTDIARREKIAPRYVERLSRLSFVAPRIVEAICQGRQPADLSAETLLNRIDVPLEWSAQDKRARDRLEPWFAGAGEAMPWGGGRPESRRTLKRPVFSSRGENLARFCKSAAR